MPSTSSFTGPLVTVGLILTVGCVELGPSSGSSGGDDAPTPDPGSLGTFDVTAEKDAADCGTGLLVLDDTWSFPATLSRDEAGEHVYWDVGKGPKEGSLDAEGLAFAISSTVVVDMRTPEDTWLPPCHIQRVDELGAKLDDPQHPSSFEGTMSFHFEPTEGSDCSDLLLGPERILQRLPCDASYTLIAKAQPGTAGGGGDGGAGGAGGGGAAGDGGGVTE